MYQNYNTRPFGSGPHYYYVPSTDLDSTMYTYTDYTTYTSMYSQLISYSMTICCRYSNTSTTYKSRSSALISRVRGRCRSIYGKVHVDVGNSWRSPSAWKKEERPRRTERSSRASMRPTDSMCISTAAARRSRSSRSRVVAAPFCTACRDPPPLPLLAFGVGKKNPRLVVLGGYLLHTHIHTH